MKIGVLSVQRITTIFLSLSATILLLTEEWSQLFLAERVSTRGYFWKIFPFEWIAKKGEKACLVVEKNYTHFFRFDESTTKRMETLQQSK